MVQQNRRSNYLLRFGPGAVLFFVGLVIVLGGIRNGYSHISQTVSELGSPGYPGSLYYNAGIVLFGIMIILFSWGVQKKLTNQRTGLTGLLLIGVMNIAGGIFPLNVKQPESLYSIIHTISGLIMLLSYLISIPLLNRSIKKNQGASAWIYKILKLSWILGFLGIILMMVTQPYGYQGLAQRIFYLSFFTWIIFFSRSLMNTKHI